MIHHLILMDSQYVVNFKFFQHVENQGKTARDEEDTCKHDRMMRLHYLRKDERFSIELATFRHSSMLGMSSCITMKFLQ